MQRGLVRLLSSWATVLTALSVCLGDQITRKMTFDQGMCKKSICDCFPNDNPQVMICECNDVIQEIHLGNLDLDIRTLERGQEVDFVPPTVRNISMGGCHRVSLSPQGLIQNAQLDTLRLSRIHTLTLSPNVFSSLKAIEVDSVYELPHLPSGLFQGGRNVKSFNFTNVTIGEIDTSAFSDVTQVDSVILDQVKIKKIAVRAFDMQMSPSSAFKISNTQIDHAETTAINVVTENFTIDACQFDVLNTGSITVTSDNFQLQGSNFIRELFPYALNVKSIQMTITDNYFQYLHPMALKNLTRKINDNDNTTHPLHFTFTQNTVADACHGSMDIDLSPYKNGTNELLNFVRVEDNFLPCNCTRPSSQTCHASFTLWAVKEAGTSQSPQKQVYYKSMIEKNQCVHPHGKGMAQLCRDVGNTSSAGNSKDGLLMGSFQDNEGLRTSQAVIYVLLPVLFTLVLTR